MNKTEKLKHIILSKYNSIREFSKIVEIPSTTLTSALDKGIGGMAVDRIIKICEVLNIDIKTFEPLESISKSTNDNYSQEEQNHIKDLRKLNDVGKEKVITYTKDLLDTPKFNNNTCCSVVKNIKLVNEKDDYIPYVFAAHNDDIDSETNKKNIEMIKKLELEKRKKKNKY